MNTPLPTKQSSFKQVFTKILAIIVGLGLIAGLSLYSRFNAIGESGSPEKFATDLAGNEKTTFNLGEEGYLNLRVYADDKEGTYSKADVILILDISNSMNTIDSSGNTRLTSAKNALEQFVDKIDVHKDMRVGFVTYTSACYLVAPLTAIDSNNAKTTLKGYIDSASVVGSGNTSIGCGVNKANNELSSNGRSDAIKKIILFTDGAENAGLALNRIYLYVGRVAAGSVLASSISRGFQFYTIAYGSSGTDMTSCTNNLPTSICPRMMRFVAAETNGLSLPSGVTWSSNYGLATNIDNKYFYKTADATELENIYKAILSEIESTGGVPVRVSEKLAGELSYVGLTSTIDKGGRSYTTTVTDGSSGEKIFQLDGLPKSYACNPGETACTNAATGNTIQNNYADFKIHFKANRKGTFDADSNYQGCDTGSLSQVSSDSKVEYLNPLDSTVYKTFVFNYLCLAINASAAAENIMKVTFGDPGRAVRKATFEAGETVYVSLIVQETDSSRTDFVITDIVPKSVTGGVDFTVERGGIVAATCTTTASDGEVKFEGGMSCQGGTTLDLREGINTIKYQYKV